MPTESKKKINLEHFAVLSFRQYNLWWQVFQNVIWSSLNIVFPTAGILGQFLAAYLCRRFGRKKTAIISSFIYLPGVALSYLAKTFAPYFELLFVGRFIWSDYSSFATDSSNS